MVRSSTRLETKRRVSARQPARQKYPPLDPRESSLFLGLIHRKHLPPSELGHQQTIPSLASLDLPFLASPL